MLELVVRLVVSLAVVVGLMLLLAKLSMRRFKGRSDSLVRVVHRQALSRSSAVAVVTVGSRVLVLGTTEHQVQLLTELDPEEVLDGDADLSVLPPATPTEQAAVATRASYAADGALAGSVLSARTWKQAFHAATRRGESTPDREAS